MYNCFAWSDLGAAEIVFNFDDCLKFFGKLLTFQGNPSGFFSIREMGLAAGKQNKIIESVKILHRLICLLNESFNKTANATSGRNISFLTDFESTIL